MLNKDLLLTTTNSLNDLNYYSTNLKLTLPGISSHNVGGGGVGGGQY